MKRTLLIFVGFMQLLLGTTVISAQVTGTDKDLKTKIDNYLSEGISNGFSGAILVAKQGKIIINKGYGMANKEKNIQNTPTTVFDIGSVTKQFTATAILKLVQFNKLKLTDPLSKFFNDLPNDKKNITIHQLLTHSAGLLDVIGGDFDHIPTEVFFKKIFATKLLQKPGSKYVYSNAGYSILARIIELVSGQDYESFLNEHLFKPAGMKQTGYLEPEWDRNLLARGYARNIFDRGSMVTRYQKDGKITWHLKGNGGINSTQEDMYKWYKALKTNKVLTQSLFEKLTTPYVKRYYGASAYGYGWGINKSDRNTKRIAHNGANGAFFHTFIWLLEEDIVIIYSTNASSPQVEKLAHSVDKMILNENYKDDPIKKGVYFLVFDFIKHNTPEKSKELISLIKNEYIADFQKPNILNRMGYMILETKKNLGWAIELFKLNVQLFPYEGNGWDSLGDGYLANGQKEEAIKSFKRAIGLNSEGTAKKLKELLQNK